MTDEAATRRAEHLRAAIRGASLRLQASLGATSPLGDSLTKGEMREDDVVAAFRPHLPARYDIFKGVVVTSSGEESGPQDVVLLDTFALAPLMGTGSNRALPVEGVVGVVQVKSIATADQIRSAVANVASAKRLLPEVERFGQPLSGADRGGTWSSSAAFFGGALFLSHRGSLDHLLEAHAQAVLALPRRERCDALCIIDEVAVLWGNPTESHGELHFAMRGEEAEAPLAIHAGGDSLVLFYVSLLEHLRHWITPPFSWLDYVLGATSSLTFPYSYWYDDQDNPPAWLQRRSGM